MESSDKRQRVRLFDKRMIGFGKSSEISVEGEVGERRRRTKQKTLAATSRKLLQVVKRCVLKWTDF